MPAPVKGKTEAGKRRESRARETRARIIEAGLRLFLEHGYGDTTVQAIAQAALVAPATIYQAFGTKHAVLAAALDVAIAGDDTPFAVLERDWVTNARHEQDRGRQLRLIVEGASQIAARTAPLKKILRDAAAAETAARDLIREDDKRRHRTQQGFVDILIEHRQLRCGIDRHRAADTFYAVVNSTMYELLVTQRGWTLPEWQTWNADLIERELFGAV